MPKRKVSTKKERLLRLFHHYREQTGAQSVDMHDVAAFAQKMGYKMPVPKTPIELLAAQLSDAARVETRIDSKTGRPYRANLAVTTPQGVLWTDIDEAPRHVAHKSFTQRREQMVGEAVQLTLDIDHWNSVNPADMPIDMPMDFAPDIEWKFNAPPDEDAAAA
jgi:hypothetical protein